MPALQAGAFRFELAAEVVFERRELGARPGGFDLLGELLVAGADGGEPGGVGGTFGGMEVAVVGVDTEQQFVGTSTGGCGFDDQFHMGVEGLAEAEGEAVGAGAGFGFEEVFGDGVGGGEGAYGGEASFQGGWRSRWVGQAEVHRDGALQDIGRYGDHAWGSSRA